MLTARDLAIGPPGDVGPPILEGFSFDLAPGEWVGVSGPNGSGKSCLALTLAGLWPAAGGEVWWDGRRLEPASRDLMGGAIGVVMQEPSTQLLEQSVASELALTARNLGRPEVQVEAGLSRWRERLDLASVWRDDPRTLSAGWQQLVLMGAALVAGPRLLVVDEGGAHLDPRRRERLLAALREEVDRGLAVLWVSQEPVELEAADRILWLGGRAAGDVAPRTPIAGTAPPPPPLVTVRIAAETESVGPRVRTPRPLELELPARGVTVLTGPNGSGKSVVLSALAGLLESAQIRLEWAQSPTGAPILCGQFPEQQLFCERVEDEVSFAAVRRGRGRDQVLAEAHKWFQSMGLTDTFVARRTWDLSTGEKRVLEVIAALLAPAPLVLLDEPTCGLDHQRKLDVAKLVRERGAEGTVVIATQDLEWARGVSGTLLDLGSTERQKDAKSQQKNGLTQTCRST